MKCYLLPLRGKEMKYVLPGDSCTVKKMASAKSKAFGTRAKIVSLDVLRMEWFERREIFFSGNAFYL